MNIVVFMVVADTRPGRMVFQPLRGFSTFRLPQAKYSKEPDAKGRKDWSIDPVLFIKGVTVVLSTAPICPCHDSSLQFAAGAGAGDELFAKS
jgi:hypothetical protein